MLDQELDRLKEIESQGFFLQLIGYTAPYFDKKYRCRNWLQSFFIKFLQHKLNISWLNENNSNNIKIIDIIENEKIKLTDGIHELILEIIWEDNKLDVSENEKIIAEFELGKDKKIPQIFFKVPINTKQHLEEFDFIDRGVIDVSYPTNVSKLTTEKIIIRSNGLQNSYPLPLSRNLGYSILTEMDTTKFSKGGYEGSVYFAESIKDNSNLKLIAKDKKFVELVKKEKVVIDNIYKEFLEQVIFDLYNFIVVFFYYFC